MRSLTVQMPNFIALLVLASSLTACVSSIKPETKQSDFYDFGLQKPEQQVDFGLPLESLSAVEAVQHGNIRYRLAYNNPTQVFTYAGSRWSSLPVELLRQQIGNNPKPEARCSLKLQLVAFDQVFDSASSSHGVVQLQASIVERRTRTIVGQTLLSAQAPASSADAKGGVAALNQASASVLQQAADWVKATAATQSCQAQ